MEEQYINQLQLEFERNANPAIAAEQKAYMRNQFEYFGIKAPHRREIQKPFLNKQYLPPKSDLTKIVKTLWKKPERDYQQFAQDLTFKYVRQPEQKDIELFEYMIAHKSWWDTVDFIAVKLVGSYFRRFPDKRNSVVGTWMDSQNIWLQRSSLLFQLKYKQDLDKDFLSELVQPLLGSKEFFINKAIGWVLREYSKTNPQWVVEFSSKTKLSPLTQREALRLIK